MIVFWDPKIRGTFQGVPILSVLVYLGSILGGSPLFWETLILGEYSLPVICYPNGSEAFTEQLLRV